ncbi:MAG: ABC transporter permease [Clostridia bacterium]|nr:ABC transporter permease [Clostridia bacterium]
MKNFRSMVYPYIIWSAVMIVIPMLMIIMYAFTKEGNSVMNIRFTLDNFAYFFQDKVFIDVLKRSLIIAVLTTIICILIGYPSAYVIAKMKPKSQMVMVLMITLPTWINMLVRTYAWRGILDKGGLINSILGMFGIGPVKLLETTFAVVLGMVYNFIPFMILQIYTALSKMDESYLEAANDLGANRVQAFFKVTLPLSVPGIISGITLVFLPAVSSFFIPKLLGGGQYVLIGNVIETQFLTTGNWGFGSAISLIMAIIIIIAMYIARRIDKRISVKGGNA